MNVKPRTFPITKIILISIFLFCHPFLCKHVWGSESEENLSLYWHRRALIENDSKAQFELSKAFFRGENIRKNYDYAFEWLCKSAKNNCYEAKNMLALIGINEQEKSIKSSYLLNLLKYFAQKNQTNTSNLYMANLTEDKPFGKYQNREIAKEFYQLDADFDTNAQVSLGYIYYEEGDIDRAIEWFTKAYEKSYPWAAFTLGFIYEKELKDDFKAIEFYKMAILRKEDDAFYRLGLIYYKQKFFDQAFKSFYAAAKDNHIYAMRYVTLMLYKGQGVKKEPAFADSYYLRTVEPQTQKLRRKNPRTFRFQPTLPNSD